MKLVITTTALAFFLGVPTYALQSQDKDKDKPAPQDEPRRQDKPESDKDRQPDKRQPDRERPPDTRQDPKAQQQSDKDREKQDRDRAQQQDRERQERDRAQGQDREQRAPEQPRDNRNRVQSQNNDRQSTRSSGGHGRHIPDDRFRASFGRQHTFHLQHGASRGGGGVQGGEGQRFQYGGYWFEYTEAWPGDWSYDDDFYIDYVDDDYYLYDERHPGIRILVIVVD
jgi:hypothetical protein